MNLGFDWFDSPLLYSDASTLNISPWTPKLNFEGPNSQVGSFHEKIDAKKTEVTSEFRLTGTSETSDTCLLRYGMWLSWPRYNHQMHFILLPLFHNWHFFASRTKTAQPDPMMLKRYDRENMRDQTWVDPPDCKLMVWLKLEPWGLHFLCWDYAVESLQPCHASSFLYGSNSSLHPRLSTEIITKKTQSNKIEYQETNFKRTFLMLSRWSYDPRLCFTN